MISIERFHTVPYGQKPPESGSIFSKKNCLIVIQADGGLLELMYTDNLGKVFGLNTNTDEENQKDADPGFVLNPDFTISNELITRNLVSKNESYEVRITKDGKLGIFRYTTDEDRWNKALLGNSISINLRRLDNTDGKFIIKTESGKVVLDDSNEDDAVRLQSSLLIKDVDSLTGFKLDAHNVMYYYNPESYPPTELPSITLVSKDNIDLVEFLNGLIRVTGTNYFGGRNHSLKYNGEIVWEDLYIDNPVKEFIPEIDEYLTNKLISFIPLTKVKKYGEDQVRYQIRSSSSGVNFITSPDKAINIYNPSGNLIMTFTNNSNYQTKSLTDIINLLNRPNSKLDGYTIKFESLDTHLVNTALPIQIGNLISDFLIWRSSSSITYYHGFAWDFLKSVRMANKMSLLVEITESDKPKQLVSVTNQDQLNGIIDTYGRNQVGNLYNLSTISPNNLSNATKLGGIEYKLNDVYSRIHNDFIKDAFTINCRSKSGNQKGYYQEFVVGLSIEYNQYDRIPKIGVVNVKDSNNYITRLLDHTNPSEILDLPTSTLLFTPSDVPLAQGYSLINIHLQDKSFNDLDGNKYKIIKNDEETEFTVSDEDPIWTQIKGDGYKVYINNTNDLLSFSIQKVEE